MATDGRRRAEILDTAAALFASSGLQASLQEIADASGILPGSLYHHFESKEAILVELIEQYRAALDEIAARAVVDLERSPDTALDDRLASLGRQLAACAHAHRAALFLTFYEPPSGAGDELVRAAAPAPMAVEAAVRDTLERGRDTGSVRAEVDTASLANRFCQVMLHVGLADFGDPGAADQVAEIRSRILVHGLAPDVGTGRKLDRSSAMAGVNEVVRAWDAEEEDDDERFAQLRSVARAEFGRRGYEATTVRDIAAAAGLSTGGVYRVIGSKERLLTSIMRSFVARVREAWNAALTPEATVIERFDALLWANINIVERFSDEYNIQLAWLRESPPSTSNLGWSFTSRMREVKQLLAEGRRSGELQVDGPTADLRAWSVFELLWMPENLVRDLGMRGALEHTRDTVLRGAAV